MQSFEGNARNAEIDLTAAAIDDGTGGEHFNTEILEHPDHFACAASGGDYVFDHHGSLAWRDFEAAAERHFIRSVALSEKRADVEGARYFVPDDDASHGRCDCQIGGKRGE